MGENRIRELADEGNLRAGTILKLIKKPQRFAWRIRIGSVFGGVGIAYCVNHIFGGYVYSLLRDSIQQHVGGAFTLLITYLLLAIFTAFLFGFLCCILPRRLVTRRPEKIVMSFTPIFAVAYTLSYPLYALCAVFAFPFVRMAGVKLYDNNETVTEEDIREMMDVGEESGAIEGIQKDMVNNVFEFDDITAAEIMTPRIDVAAVNVEDSLIEALRIAFDNGFSRLPVYEEDIDHIIGILYIKDLLPYVGRALPKNVTIRILLRDTLFVPDTKKCDELFEEKIGRAHV